MKWLLYLWQSYLLHKIVCWYCFDCSHYHCYYYRCNYNHCYCNYCYYYHCLLTYQLWSYVLIDAYMIIRSILNSIIKMTFYVQKQSFLHQMNANYVHFLNRDSTSNLTIIIICCFMIEYHKYLMEKLNGNKIWIIIQFDHKIIISWSKSIIFEYLESILSVYFPNNRIFIQIIIF